MNGRLEQAWLHVRHSLHGEDEHEERAAGEYTRSTVEQATDILRWELGPYLPIEGCKASWRSKRPRKKRRTRQKSLGRVEARRITNVELSIRNQLTSLCGDEA